MTNRALITGITGQDGSYLAELLLSKGYEVHGLIRRASTSNTERIDHLYQDSHDLDARLFLHFGDLTNSEQLTNLLYNLQPHEVYHLGAQSHVQVSYDMPEYTGNVTALGTTRLLEAIRWSGIDCRMYQASSSEMFGSTPPPQNEDTPLQPHNPYACAKTYAYWLSRIYREAYGIYVCNGVMFNHESPRRGQTFVTRKITKGLADILARRLDYLYLGNLNAKRDWGFAPEYVEMMWLMLQQPTADDYVIGTGEAHSVREFLEVAFQYVDLDWQKYVKLDDRYTRPTEVDALLADSSKARRTLGWKPRISFDDLVKIMVDSDLSAAGLQPPGHGYAVLKSTFGTSPYWRL